MHHSKRRYNKSDTASVDMTPMLDIVFIMLIFFIVTAVFLDEAGLDFTHPPSDCIHCPPSSKTITVVIDSKNQVSVDRVPVKLDGVPHRVERMLAEKPDANVLILASRKATLDPIIYVKDQMNIAGRTSRLKMVQ